MIGKREGPVLAVICIGLLGFLGVKHGGARLNRVPDFDPIEFEDGTGQHEWSPEGGSTLVVFFRTDSPACEASIPSWKQLYFRSCSDLRFLFLSAEPWETISGSPLMDPWEPVEGCEPIAIGRPLDRNVLQQKYDLQAIPAQFLVGDGGVVRTVLFGAPREGQATRLFGGVM